eukprot:9961586-Lingulodinium_polyedra.AAC.1
MRPASLRKVASRSCFSMYDHFHNKLAASGRRCPSEQLVTAPTELYLCTPVKPCVPHANMVRGAK